VGIFKLKPCQESIIRLPGLPCPDKGLPVVVGKDGGGGLISDDQALEMRQGSPQSGDFLCGPGAGVMGSLIVHVLGSGGQ
jgi:hypothetical protein